MNSYKQRACSLERDPLWSVLDLDALPHIFEMAEDKWKLDAATAWSALLQQARLGRLKARREIELSIKVDPTRISLDEVTHGHELFVGPAEATFTRLNEIHASMDDGNAVV